jgi:uncharacterized protein YhbP (UPF0306 family)
MMQDRLGFEQHELRRHMTDPTTTPEAASRAAEFLRGNMTMTLATASPTGVPRATTLHYASDELDLYVWVRSQAWAARQIEQNPLVSFAIAQEGAGLQGSGRARVLLSGDEVAHAVELFSEKFPMALGSSTMNISFFRIVPTDIKLVDERYAGGRGDTQMFGEADFTVDHVYSIIAELPVGELGLISGSLQRIEAEAGSTIARQGAPADKFMIVLDGEVEVVRESDGQAETVATLGPGDFFGEVAVLSEAQRTASLRAASAATLLTMDGDQFSGVVGQALGAPDFERIIRERLGGT